MAREMKDSGIEWIGKIPASWTLRRLQWCLIEVAEKNDPIRTTQILSLTNKQGVLPYEDKGAQGNKAKENLAEYKLAYEDTLIVNSMNVIIGSVGISHYFGCVSPVYYVFKETNESDLRFINYIFNTVGFQKECRKFAKGILEIRLRISTSDLFKRPIPLPNIDKQRKIADYLDKECAEIDAVLEKTHNSIEEYKKLKQAMITQAVTKGVRGDRSMKESGIIWLDAVPEDWEISKIKYAIFPHEKPVLPTDDVITCFRDGIVTLRKNRREEGFTVSFTENGYQGVDVGDLVIHGMDTFAGAIGCSDSRGKTSPVVHVCSTIGNNRYFMYFLRYMAYSNVLMDFSNGVRIRSSDFRNFKKLAVFEMLVPPLEEQNEIVNYLDSILAKIEQVIKQKELLLNELESYKKTVTYEYVTGKKEATPKQQIQEIVVHPFFPAVFQATNRRFAQAILMSKVLDSCKVKMGRVKLEKMMFVLENSIGFDFDTEYVREAAGPLDKSIYECEQIISRKNKWFTIRKSQYGVSYKPTSEHSKYKKYYAQYFSDYEDAIDNVISIFNDFDTDQAEVIATLYGAWNDCIIDKRSYTDNDIVDEVLNHWHPKKRRFPKDMWLRAIQRMRELDLIPHGYGRHTVIKQN